MQLTELPLPPAIWAATPGAAQALILVQRERIHELEVRLGQNSSNSSRPPGSDPPQAPPRPKAAPTGRKRGAQPGHRGAFRALLPVEQVDEIVTVVPDRCRHCEQPFALWHRFRAGECDRQELRRRLIPLQARLGRLLRGLNAYDFRYLCGDNLSVQKACLLLMVALTRTRDHSELQRIFNKY